MRTLFAACLVVSVSSCSLFNKAIRGESIDARDVGHAAVSEAGSLARYERQAESKCGPGHNREVPWEEEISIGGAVTLAMAGKSKGVFVELSPELPTGDVDAAAWKDKKPKPGTGAKTDLHVYIDTLGKALAASSSRPSIDWKFVVIEDEGLNAFSAPGGYVMITTGLLKKLDNEAQLAGVLAHEIGHITHRHALTAYKETKYSVCKVATAGSLWLNDARREGQASVDFALRGTGLTEAAITRLTSEFTKSTFDTETMSAEIIGKLVEPVADSVINKGLGPDREYEADETAVQLMAFNGYDAKEYRALLAKLPEGGMGHPPNKDRLAKLDTAIAANADFGPFKAPPLDPRIKAAIK